MIKKITSLCFVLYIAELDVNLQNYLKSQQKA